MKYYTAMKYYISTTQFNCGIDLHAHQMYVCVMDRDGKKLLHTNIRNNDFAYFLKLVAPYRHDLTVCAECMFGWYWLTGLRWAGQDSVDLIGNSGRRPWPAVGRRGRELIGSASPPAGLTGRRQANITSERILIWSLRPQRTSAKNWSPTFSVERSGQPSFHLNG